MKAGDMIMFVKTGEYATFIGHLEGVYIFQHKDFIMRVPEENFCRENVEVVK
jgi:hypothetical protein